MESGGRRLTVEDALALVLADPPAPRSVEVGLLDALGRVLAEDVVADISMPPFDKSAMDGYAVRSEETAAAPAELAVVDDIPAGKFPTRKIGRGEAARIMTGAPVPPGADAVVMVEQTEAKGRDRVVVRNGVKPGENICALGEDLREGSVALRRGKIVRPPEVAILASCGQSRVRVVKAPTVTLMSTGDELVEIDRKPEKGQIRNSNTWSLAAQVRAMGLPCAILGVARDTKEAIRAMAREGLDRGDVLIVSGGVSVGEYDFVADALQAEGVQCLMHKVMIKPGRPFYFGRKGDQRVFALPGNPVSTYVIFDVFVKPFLNLARGMEGGDVRRMRALVTSPLDRRSDRLQYIPGLCDLRGGRPTVAPVPWHGSADIAALTRADCFIVLPPNAPPLKEGDGVDIQLL
ncbi:MAG: hypothetical protein A2Z34_04495 [Planctomycetes bacterium RBG_16_59_8]|nr:MAG: hypothetical protein A2Z34_04495 [Planctomycetes bacterium RBG_16_59_8]